MRHTRGTALLVLCAAAACSALCYPEVPGVVRADTATPFPINNLVTSSVAMQYEAATIVNMSVAGVAASAAQILCGSQCTALSTCTGVQVAAYAPFLLCRLFSGTGASVTSGAFQRRCTACTVAVRFVCPHTLYATQNAEVAPTIALSGASLVSASIVSVGDSTESSYPVLEVNLYVSAVDATHGPVTRLSTPIARSGNIVGRDRALTRSASGAIAAAFVLFLLSLLVWGDNGGPSRKQQQQ